MTNHQTPTRIDYQKSIWYTGALCACPLSHNTDEFCSVCKGIVEQMKCAYQEGLAEGKEYNKSKEV